MSNSLVVLVLVMTTFLSGLLSPASGLSFRGRGGSNVSIQVPPVGGIPPGGVLEASIVLDRIDFICIKENLDDCSDGDDIPMKTQLVSKNPDVASVENPSEEDPSDFQIVLHRTGSTILELRNVPDNDEIRVSYVLVVTPPLPGTDCATSGFIQDGIVDCSSKCVSRATVVQRFGDGTCDDGQEEREGESIDLSCVFIPEFFVISNDILKNSPFASRTARDGGDCSPEESCTAQFGKDKDPDKVPGFKLCAATDNLCSFNAITSDPTTGAPGTCAAMCQRREFRSRCVAALSNPLAGGCDPLPDSRDTCNTRRQTEICVCERR